MNNVFRLIWNRTLGRLVVASEAARSQHKAGSGSKQVGEVSQPSIIESSVLRPLTLALALSLGGLTLLPNNAHAYAVGGANGCAAGNNTRIGIGEDAEACGNNNIAIGAQSVSSDNNINLLNRENPFYAPDPNGSNSLFNGVASSSVALGTSAEALGGGVAIGGYANTERVGVAIGAHASAAVSALALGPASRAANQSSLAFGRQSFAGANYAQAIGTVSAAVGESSLAIGHSATAEGQQGIAIGGVSGGANYNDTTKTHALGDYSIAIGADDVKGAQSTGVSAIAIGGQAESAGDRAIAIGSKSTTGALFGNYAYRRNDNNGVDSSVSSIENAAIALGSEANVDAGGIAIGSSSNASGTLGVAIGGSAVASGASAFALGPAAYATGGQSLSVGYQSAATGERSLSIGPVSTSTGEESVALGASALASGNRAFALGSSSIDDSGWKQDTVNNTQATGDDSLAFGTSAQATQANTIAVGTGSQATGIDAIAMGSGAKASGEKSISIGYKNEVSGANSGALGDPSYVSGSGTYTIGNNNGTLTNPIAADKAGIFGNNNQMSAAATGSRVIGNNNDIDVADAMVFGNNADVTQGGGVALGSNSLANTAAGAAGYVPFGASTADATAINSTVATRAAVDVGSRQITSVAAGTQLDDAVNVSQLIASQSKVQAGTNVADVTATENPNGGTIYTVNANGTTVSAGAGVDVNPAGPDANNVTDYEVSLDAATQTSLGNADTALQEVVTQIGGVDVKTIDQNDNVANFIEGQNIDLIDNSGSIEVATLDNVTFTDVQTDTLSAGPISIGAGGIDAGDTTISGVADGVNADDAVNISQLENTAAASKTEVTGGTNIASVDKATGADGQDIYTVNADGASVSAGSGAVDVKAGAKDPATNLTDYAVDLSQDSKDSLDLADNALQEVVTQVDGADVKTLTKGDNNANFVTGKNMALSDDGAGGIEIATADNVTFSDVKTDTLSAGPVTIGAAGINAGNTTISGVADGVNADDAVNISQLENTAAASKTEVVAGTNTTVDQATGTDGQDIYTVNAKDTT
ncbi:ESPR-type extended signal peptide-containing protein, partial [Vreelandella alkaliphila]